jgi:hypothetical protein
MANKTVDVTIPDYFSVKHYKSMGSFEHMEEVDKIIAVVTATTEHSEEDVMEWSLPNLLSIYKGISAILNDVTPTFYPVFEFKGVTYGFQPLSKMSVAEWIDLENRMKDPIKNMEGILAILYRPIVEHKFDGMKWNVKSYIKTLTGNTESIFNYYTIENYDTEKRGWREKVFEDLPIEYALGCYTFFLAFTLMLQRDILSYSPEVKASLKKELMKEIDEAIKGLQSNNITAGSTYYEDWKLQSSLESQANKTFLK